MWDTRAQTFGCGSAIASSSVATEWVKGMSLDDAVKIKNTEIATHLNLPPVKLHCSMLAEDAIKAAVCPSPHPYLLDYSPPCRQPRVKS